MKQFFKLALFLKNKWKWSVKTVVVLFVFVSTGLLVAQAALTLSATNITSDGPITISAGGTNQNVTTSPSGTGYTILGGNVGIGTATPGTKLQVADSITTTVDSLYDLGSSSIFWANTYTDNIWGPSDTNLKILLNTSDGSDDQTIWLTAGGASANSRGAQIRIYGNEVSSGVIDLMPGNTGANAAVNFKFGVSSINAYTAKVNDFSPVTDSAKDLGTSSLFWDETFTDEIVLTNAGTAATATDTVRLGGTDLAAGDAALLITSEDDTQYKFGSFADFGGPIVKNTGTIAVDDTTPDVSGGNIFTTSANTIATAITDLDLPQVGQIVYIVGGSDTNSSTIADSGNFNLSVVFTASLDDVLILLVQADNDYIEIGRVNN